MTKNQKKQHQRPGRRSERKTENEPRVAPSRMARIKQFSKKLIHNYIIPMTRDLERGLQRLERGL